MKRKLLIASAAAALALMAAGTAWAAAKKKRPPPRPIDLNHATIEQLEELPGVGPVTAQRIVEFRQKSGPFKSVDDLLAIHGISRGRLEKMRPYVVIRPSEKPRPGAGSHPAKKPPHGDPGG
ncbi:MAG TPA: helix-hairpin-helix domain-containing protein [Candidatus Acidoferrales bacterium]|nr:helix-hairpin-helix domain-containing protein [Candidatus Acidoferrales bacterium]